MGGRCLVSDELKGVAVTTAIMAPILLLAFPAIRWLLAAAIVVVGS